MRIFRIFICLCRYFINTSRVVFFHIWRIDVALARCVIDKQIPSCRERTCILIFFDVDKCRRISPIFFRFVFYSPKVGTIFVCAISTQFRMGKCGNIRQIVSRSQQYAPRRNNFIVKIVIIKVCLTNIHQETNTARILRRSNCRAILHFKTNPYSIQRCVALQAKFIACGIQIGKFFQIRRPTDKHLRQTTRRNGGKLRKNVRSILSVYYRCRSVSKRQRIVKFTPYK